MQTVDAIVPLYNETAEAIEVTVKGLSSQSYPLQCIWLVDDGSTRPLDFSLAARVAQVPVEILRLKQNQGISSARNEAAQRSSADLLLFVNTHIELLPGWLEKAVNFICSTQDAGIAIGQITLNQRGPYATWRGLFLESKETSIDRSHEITLFVGHAVLVSAKHLCKVGGWNQELKRAYEDIDLSQRLRGLGLKSYQVQGATAICHDRYTIRDLTIKSIRNWGWSLDPWYPGDRSLRPLEFPAALKHFLIMSFSRFTENLRKSRFTLIVVDLAVIAYGSYVIIGGSLKKAFLQAAR
jgi:GT2 family glycosyltransferase